MRRQSGLMNFLFWCTFFIAVLAAWFHTFQVFRQSDEWYIAALAATAIDGALAYSIHAGGVMLGQQRNVALIGTIIFAAMSGMAQVIQRFYGLNAVSEMPILLRYVSLGLVPAATTGAVVVLGFIRYFDHDGNWIPDFMERKQKQQFRGQPQGQQRRPERFQPTAIPTEHPGQREFVGRGEDDTEEFVPIRSPVNPQRAGPRPTNGDGPQSRFSQEIERPPSLPPETGG